MPYIPDYLLQQDTVPRPMAQPEFHVPSPAPVEEEDPFADISMTYPAQEAFRNFITEQPTREQYQPSKLRRILAGAGGFSAGWQQGPAAGVGLAQGIIDTPYHQALENWKLGLSPRQHAAQIEATTAGQQYSNAYRRARLKQLGARSLSATSGDAAMGNPIALYNRKTDTTRWVQKFRDGTFRDTATQNVVPGPGPDEEQRVQQYQTFNTISSQGGVPTLTMSGVDRQKMINKADSAFVNTNVPVAEPGEIGVNKFGEQAGITGKTTGVQRPLTPAAPPGQAGPPSLRKTGMTSGEMNQRAEINIMRNDFNTLKANMPEIMKQLVGPRKNAIARAKSSNYNVLAEFWDPAKPTPVQAAALTAEKAMQDTVIRMKEGANIPQWIWGALEKTLPNSKQPAEVYTQNFERFEKVLKLTEDERNMVDPERFNLEFSKIITPPATPQSKLSWAKTPAGKVYVFDPAEGKPRPVRPGEILDPKLEKKK